MSSASLPTDTPPHQPDPNTVRSAASVSSRSPTTIVLSGSRSDPGAEAEIGTMSMRFTASMSRSARCGAAPIGTTRPWTGTAEGHWRWMRATMPSPRQSRFSSIQVVCLYVCASSDQRRNRDVNRDRSVRCVRAETSAEVAFVAAADSFGVHWLSLSARALLMKPV